VSISSDPDLPAGGRVRFLLGFFVMADGQRIFDRIRLLTHGDRVGGELSRLASGSADPETFRILGGSAVDGLSLTLEPDAGGETQILSLAARTDGESHERQGLVRLGSGESCSYIAEEVEGICLERSPTHGWGTIATQSVSAGSRVAAITGPFSADQTPYSFRTSDDRHVEPTGYGHFVNHACEPTCRIEYRADGRPVLIANRNLVAGDEVTFDYTVTEGDLAGSFACRCPAATHKV
jgi:hypothetical protein